MATLGALITECRDELQEPTAGLWSDTEFTRWLNDGAKELARVAKVDGAPSTVVTVAGTETVALPTNCLALRRVEIDTDGTGNYVPLSPTTIDEHNSEQGRPGQYTVFNSLIYLFPVPDAAYTIKRWFQQSQPTMTSSDTPIIDEQFHHLIKKYALAQAKRKVDDPAYTTYASEYEAGKADMARFIEERKERERYPVIRDDWDAVEEESDIWRVD